MFLNLRHHLNILIKLLFKFHLIKLKPFMFLLVILLNKMLQLKFPKLKLHIHFHIHSNANFLIFKYPIINQHIYHILLIHLKNILTYMFTHLFLIIQNHLANQFKIDLYILPHFYILIHLLLLVNNHKYFLYKHFHQHMLKLISYGIFKVDIKRE